MSYEAYNRRERRHNILYKRELSVRGGHVLVKSHSEYGGGSGSGIQRLQQRSPEVTVNGAAAAVADSDSGSV